MITRDSHEIGSAIMNFHSCPWVLNHVQVKTVNSPFFPSIWFTKAHFCTKRGQWIVALVIFLFSLVHLIKNNHVKVSRHFRYVKSPDRTILSEGSLHICMVCLNKFSLLFSLTPLVFPVDNNSPFLLIWK